MDDGSHGPGGEEGPHGKRHRKRHKPGTGPIVPDGRPHHVDSGRPHHVVGARNRTADANHSASIGSVAGRPSGSTTATAGPGGEGTPPSSSEGGGDVRSPAASVLEQGPGLEPVDTHWGIRAEDVG